MDCQSFKPATLLNIVLITVSGMLCSLSVQAEDAVIIDYRGQADIGTTPYSGHGYVKFSIIDDPITPSRNIWTNDGSKTGPGKEPNRAVTLSLKSGQFSIALGNKQLGNMTTLGSGVDNDDEAYLRVWFSVDGTHFEQLSPDTQLHVPYSSDKTDPLQTRSANAITGISILSTAQVIGNTRKPTGIINAAALDTPKIP